MKLFSYLVASQLIGLFVNLFVFCLSLSLSAIWLFIMDMLMKCNPLVFTAGCF